MLLPQSPSSSRLQRHPVSIGRLLSPQACPPASSCLSVSPPLAMGLTALSPRSLERMPHSDFLLHKAHVTWPRSPPPSAPSFSLTALRYAPFLPPDIPDLLVLRAIAVPSAWNFLSSDLCMDNAPYCPTSSETSPPQRDQGLSIYLLPAYIPPPIWSPFLRAPRLNFSYKLSVRNIIICERSMSVRHTRLDLCLSRSQLFP